MNNLSLDRHCREGRKYIEQLAKDLGHPGEEQRALIIWRAVMHVIRDRIHIGESFDLLSQLPLLLKGIYVDQWKYHDKPPKDYDTIEEMKNEVKKLQAQYGEQQFDWKKSTEEIISITLDSLKVYFSEGQLAHIEGQMPAEVKAIFN